MVIEARPQPIEQAPEVVLKDRALQGIDDEALAAAPKKLVEELYGGRVRWLREKEGGLAPKQRIDLVQPMFLPVCIDVHVQGAMKAVPEMGRIIGIDAKIQALRSPGLPGRTGTDGPIEDRARSRSTGTASH